MARRCVRLTVRLKPDTTMRNVVSAFRRTLRLQAIATLLVPGLVATIVSGCVLNKPPDAAAIKEQSLPWVQTPQWTAAGAGAGAVSNNWLATFRDDELTAAVSEAIVYNADLLVGAARVEQAQLHAKLAGAKL